MKLKFATGVLFVILFCGLNARAQQTTSEGIPIKKITPKGPKPGSKDSTVIKKGTPQKDLSDVIADMLHSKKTPEIDSITTKPQISVVPAVGYPLVTSFAVVVSGNIAFRTGPQSRISTVVASASYTEKKQFIMPIQTNFWSRDNKY